jgi:hypothetical protein
MQTVYDDDLKKRFRVAAKSFIQFPHWPAVLCRQRINNNQLEPGASSDSMAEIRRCEGTLFR